MGGNFVNGDIEAIVDIRKWVDCKRENEMVNVLGDKIDQPQQNQEQELVSSYHLDIQFYNVNTMILKEKAHHILELCPSRCPMPEITSASLPPVA